MSSHVLIRPFQSTEWLLYRELRLRALADSPDAFARTLAEEQDRSDEERAQRLANTVNSPDWLALVALDAERPVGIAFAQLDSQAREIVHLYSMWVDPAARRAHIGNSLVERVIQWSTELGAQRIVLQVTDGNAAARRLYENAKFLSTGQRTPLRETAELLVVTMQRILR